jgi:folate-binding Fe-S cluster repair protein YgfZ
MNQIDTKPQRREALLKGLKHLAFWAQVQKASDKSITEILQSLRLQVRKIEAAVSAAGRQRQQMSPISSSTNPVSSPSSQE